jgi:hypothetical protein
MRRIFGYSAHTLPVTLSGSRKSLTIHANAISGAADPVGSASVTVANSRDAKQRHMAIPPVAAAPGDRS